MSDTPTAPTLVPPPDDPLGCTAFCIEDGKRCTELRSGDEVVAVMHYQYASVLATLDGKQRWINPTEQPLRVIIEKGG